MQDEINDKVIAISINTGRDGVRLTSDLLREALRRYLAEQDRRKLRRENKKTVNPKDTVYHGKQTISRLMKQDQKLTNIQVTNDNIKSFEHVARKYNIDYALKKDRSKDPPRYMVFFKARDVDVMHAAFKEYAIRELTKTRKPSVRKALNEAIEKANKLNRHAVKQKYRGIER